MESAKRDSRDRRRRTGRSRPRPIERPGPFGPGPFEEPLAPHGIRRSKDPAKFQTFELRSVMPELSVTMTGNWPPATDPAATMGGLPVNVTTSWALPAGWVQVAVTPHMRFAT